MPRYRRHITAEHHIAHRDVPRHRPPTQVQRPGTREVAAARPDTPKQQRSRTLSDALAIELAQGWPMQLREEPQANVDRYDRLRGNDADTAGAGVSP